MQAAKSAADDMASAGKVKSCGQGECNVAYAPAAAMLDAITATVTWARQKDSYIIGQ